MSEMSRTAADLQARARLRELGAVLLTEHVMLEWHGNGADVQASGGKAYRIDADTLVIAATNVSERWLGGRDRQRHNRRRHCRANGSHGDL